MSEQGKKLQDWIGRQESSAQMIDVAQVEKMAATMSFSPLCEGVYEPEQSLGVGDHLPAAWHWAWFNPARPVSELGRDGHPQKGGFLPPVDLPRRMWAGGRLAFHAPIIIGQNAERVSTIENVLEKEGRSGKLCFVTVRHEISQEGALVLTEHQDIVYREDPKAVENNRNETKPQPNQAIAEAADSFRVTPSAVWMFRYSALTFNGHRIHYDLDYAQNVEGYPHLVFHGPLTATLLMELAVDAAVGAGKRLCEFSFKAKNPLFGNAPFVLHRGALKGEVISLWAETPDGKIAMQAEAKLK